MIFESAKFVQIAILTNFNPFGSFVKIDMKLASNVKTINLIDTGYLIAKCVKYILARPEL